MAILPGTESHARYLLPVGAILWWLYMTRIEKMTSEMSTFAANAAHGAMLAQ